VVLHSPFLDGDVARFRVRLYFLFRSVLRVGDPVIPFLLAGSFLFSFDIPIEHHLAFACSQMTSDPRHEYSGKQIVKKCRHIASHIALMHMYP